MKWMTALNAKRKMNNGSECQMKKVMALISKWKWGSERQTEDVALNTKLKTRLWTPRWQRDSERQDDDTTLNVRMYMWLWMSSWKGMMALNAQTKKIWWLWTPSWDMMVALNAEIENMTLNVKLRSDDGSERRNWEATMMALNAKIEKVMMRALNVEIKNAMMVAHECRNWKCDSERHNG